jgi:hypothetical protein
MKKLACFLLLLAVASLAAAADVSGTWTGTWAPEGGNTGSAYLVLKQSGATVTGTAGPNAETQWPIAGGKIAGNLLTLQVTDPDNVLYKCTMTVTGNKIAGNIDVVVGGQTQKAKIELTKGN